jgi:hypothetical protein
VSRAAAAAIAVCAACARPVERSPAVVDVAPPAKSGDPVRLAPASSVPPPRPPRAATFGVTLLEGNDEPLSSLVRAVTLEFGRACTQDTSAPPPWSLVLDVTIERRPVAPATVGVGTHELHGAPRGCADTLTRVYVSGTWPNGAGTEGYRVRIAYE